MTKRVAALFALFAFAIAWLVGVWCGHAPITRLENAAIALVSGLLAGLGVGVALERIVLARLSEQWRETTAAPPPQAAKPVAKPAAAAPAFATASAAATAVRSEAEAIGASGEAKR